MCWYVINSAILYRSEWLFEIVFRFVWKMMLADMISNALVPWEHTANINMLIMFLFYLGDEDTALGSREHMIFNFTEDLDERHDELQTTIWSIGKWAFYAFLTISFQTRVLELITGFEFFYIYRYISDYDAGFLLKDLEFHRYEYVYNDGDMEISDWQNGRANETWEDCWASSLNSTNNIYVNEWETLRPEIWSYENGRPGSIWK